MRAFVLRYRYRLTAIQSLFPHGSSITPEMEGIYDEMLELLRPGVCNLGARKCGLQLLSTQILAQETSALVTRITKWPVDELRSFLSEIVAFITSEIQVLSPEESVSEHHPILPFLTFLFRLAQVNQQSYDASSDAGDTILTQFSDNPLIVDHPIRILCSRREVEMKHVPLAALITYPPRSRREMWRKLAKLEKSDESLIFQRLREIDGILDGDTWGNRPAELLHASMDLVEFCRPVGYEAKVTNWAFSSFLSFIAHGGEFWDALLVVLVFASREEITVFSRAISCLGPFSEMPYGDEFHQALRKNGHADWTDIDVTGYFLRFSIKAASRDPAISAILLDPLVSIRLLTLHSARDYLPVRFRSSLQNLRTFAEDGDPNISDLLGSIAKHGLEHHLMDKLPIKHARTWKRVFSLSSSGSR